MDAFTEIEASSQPEPDLSVMLAPERAAPPVTEGPSENANLVSALTEDEQKKIVEAVLRDYDADVDSRKPRMMRLKEYQGLYASVMKAKSFPFKNAANVNLPVLTTPSMQLQGRLYDMVWPANGKIFYSSATNLEDMVRAHVTETFGNAYIRHRMPEMEQGLDDTLHQVVIYGSAFRRTYWNADEGRVCSDWIPIEDFVVANDQRSQDPSMRDTERYTHVHRYSYFTLERLSDKGIYENFDKVKLTDPDDPKESEFSDQLKKIDGNAASSETTIETKKRMVLDQYLKWRMPNAPDVSASFDGKPHAVIATIDEQSRTLLRFVVREEPDPDDFARFSKEQAAFDGYLQAMSAYLPEAQAAQTVSEAAAAMGAELPPDFQHPMPPPVPRGLVMDEATGMPSPPEPQRVRDISSFTHYRAFPSEGFYGLGLGDFMAGLNKAVNTMVNQTIDRGTLQLSSPGFISAQLKGQRGSVNVQPGEMIEVDAPMGSIKDGFYFPQFPPNDPSIMRIVQMLMEAADKMVASSDMMSGQTSGANRTAKEAQILSEQMMMQITVLARRIKGAFKHELDKIWRCWGVFLPEDELVDIEGHDGADPTQLRIGRAMFTPNAHVTPAADPRTKTQKLEESQQVYQAVAGNPYLMNQPPPVRDAIMRQVTEDVLQALGAGKLIKLLPPPGTPKPPPPPPPAPYWQEDAGFLRGQDHQVHKDDNDLEHISGHQRTLQGPAGTKLDKQGRDMLERHIRFHVAADIEKAGMRQQQMEAQLAGVLGPQLGAPPMQGPPMNGTPMPMGGPQ